MKHIHFIGICGVAMSALAIAFSKNNWRVTGSDVGFYPPVSTNLKKNNIKFYPGWHEDKMCSMGIPDLVVVGNVASSTNPEWLFVKNNKINHCSYPEAVAKYIVKKNSIVCAGTYGKTTTSAIMSWILKCANFNPSYMFGGLANNENFEPAFFSCENHTSFKGKNIPASNYDSDINDDMAGTKKWSVLEGDEYKTARWDNSPKFNHYSPTHLLLTSIVWDHMDVYPTEESYLKAFKQLISMIPKDGLAVVSENVTALENEQFKCQLIKYGQTNADYIYSVLSHAKDGLEVKITCKNEQTIIKSKMLGRFNAENIVACYAMAREINIPSKTIINALNGFLGIKRRLQKRSISEPTVFDDIAHSPAKAAFTLNALRDAYKQSRIFAVFEPNTGNRQQQSAFGYDNAFKNADEVIIPRLTKIKTDKNAENEALNGLDLKSIISKTHSNCRYIDEDSELLHYLKSNAKKDDIIVFLGSHGFRSMIEELTT
ncbi:MAG: Mur ligase family protein [bacterium]